MMELKLAWRNLWRNKVRTGIMIGAIGFAVLISVFMRSVQEGMYDRQIDNMVGFYSGYIQLQHQEYWEEKSMDYSLEYNAELQNKLDAEKRIDAYSPRIESGVMIASNKITKGVMIIATDPQNEDALTKLSKKVVEGKYFQENDKTLMIGKLLAKYLQVGVGDTLVMIGQGYHGMSAAGKYTVSALLEFGAPELNKRMVYIPLKEGQYMFSANGLVTSVAMNLKSNNDLEAVQASLISSFDPKKFKIMNWKEMMPDMVKMIDQDRSGGIIMLLVLYIIIGFVMLGTLLMMIKERAYEFGVMVSIGLQKYKLSLILMFESVFMAILGALVGGTLSMIPMYMLQEYPVNIAGDQAKAYETMNFEALLITRFDLSFILQQGIVVSIMALVLALYPVIKVLVSNPLKEMRR